LDRRDERRVRADENAVADHGTVLVRAVVVARDRAGSDVHIRADGRVADVAQVVDLAAGGDVGLLRLDEVADLHALGEPRARPNPRERPELAALSGVEPFYDGMRMHDGVRAELRVLQHAVRADPHAVAEHDPALEDDADVDEDVAADLDRAANVEPLWI